MKHLRTVMGVPMSIDIRSSGAPSATQPGEEESAAGAAFAILEAAEARFSPFRADSEVSRVNRGEVRLKEYSAPLRDVLAIASAAHRASGGAFTTLDPDGHLDLNGVVKGWAASRASAALRASGFPNHCLNAGGDIAASGRPAPGERWHVGVRTPDDPHRMLTVLAIVDAAVATSGAYERGEHIIDGRTGMPARALRSVTVLAGDLTSADVLATAVYALGVAGVSWARHHGALGVLAVDAENRIHAAGNLPIAAPGVPFSEEPVEAE